MSVTEHICPKPTFGMMPIIMEEFAISGNEEKVMAWLEKGGDINASNKDNQTVLFLACKNGHIQLLKKLLEHPEVHLNQKGKTNRCGNAPPLVAALENSHQECALALLSSQLMCPLDRNNNPSIVIAAQHGLWEVVEKMLPLLDYNVIPVLNLAVGSRKVDILRKIISQIANDNFIKNSSHDGFASFNSLQRPQIQLYSAGLWKDSGAEVLYQNDVRFNRDQVKMLLVKVLQKKDWETLETLLKMVVQEIVVRSDLAEVLAERKSEEVLKILTEEKLENSVMSGALLVASIGGTSEEVVDELLHEKHDYSLAVLEECLILTSLNNNAEFLPRLMKKCFFSFSTLIRANNLMNQRSNGMKTLINQALKNHADDIVPLKQKEQEQ